MEASIIESESEQRLREFAGKVAQDIAGAFAVLLSFIGDQTGIYRVLRDRGPSSAAELARACRVDERYLREWLSAQAAGGYVRYDMGDPVGAARHLRQCLKPDGTLMVVEPLAGDSLAENLHLQGQLYYSFSTLICTPASRAQEVGLALGAQAGEKRLRRVLADAGFTRVRCAARTESNMVLEARP